MKLKIRLMGITLLLVIVAIGFGCAQPKKGATPKPPITKNDETQQKNTTEKKENPVYPQEVINHISILKPIFAGSFIESGGKTYILVSWGLKNTAGYGVGKVNLQDNGDKVTLTVSFIAPPAGGIVNQVITNPYLVETINHPVKEVDFIGTGGESNISVIRGLPQAKPFITQTENIKIMEFKIQNGLTITGLARVFEAALNYEIQDGNKKTLQKGFIMTAGGAPDWGYFKITASAIPTGAKYVELYSTSPKDGHKLDINTLEIK